MTLGIMILGRTDKATSCAECKKSSSRMKAVGRSSETIRKVYLKWDKINDL